MQSSFAEQVTLGVSSGSACRVSLLPLSLVHACSARGDAVVCQWVLGEWRCDRFCVWLSCSSGVQGAG